MFGRDSNWQRVRTRKRKNSEMNERMRICVNEWMSEEDRERERERERERDRDRDRERQRNMRKFDR